MPNLTAIDTLQTLFTDEAARLARERGLVRRNSKLTGPLILLILVAGFIQHPTASYNILAQVATDYGVTLTRQAIQQRLTPAAIAFFQALFERSLRLLQVLQARYQLPVPILTQFSAVYLLDSSQVALPPALTEQYPGTGGDGPKEKPASSGKSCGRCSVAIYSRRWANRPSGRTSAIVSTCSGWKRAA